MDSYEEEETVEVKSGSPSPRPSSPLKEETFSGLATSSSPQPGVNLLIALRKVDAHKMMKGRAETTDAGVRAWFRGEWPFHMALIWREEGKDPIIFEFNDPVGGRGGSKAQARFDEKRYVAEDLAQGEEIRYLPHEFNTSEQKEVLARARALIGTTEGNNYHAIFNNCQTAVLNCCWPGQGETMNQSGALVESVAKMAGDTMDFVVENPGAAMVFSMIGLGFVWLTGKK